MAVKERVTNTERDRDAERKREQRQSARTVVIPKCKDPARRKRLEADDEAWLAYYFGPDCGIADPFTYAFTKQHKEMIAAIRDAIATGNDQAIAASRGEGKTTLAERVLLKYVLQGAIFFPVLFAATGSAAADSLETIKTAIEENTRLLEDYPEVCVPVIALENTPNRAHYQVVAGHRHDNGKPFGPVPSRFSWCGQEIYLPNVPGSPSAGSIIATRGLDSAVRGLKKKGRRPDVALIDDPDTEETARSEDQAKKLEDRIDKGIGGLGAQRRRIARVMLTTLQNRTCVSYKYTDPQQKKSWRGKRFRFLIKPPDNTALWDEFIVLKGNDWESGTDAAHEFYLANQSAMDAGAIVANPHRHTHEESTALEFYYTQVARLGPEAVATEYDNDPPEETGPVESGITSHRVQRQVSGYAKRIVPATCKVVVQGIDCKKAGLHWVVRAFEPNASGYTIDYGFHQTHGTIMGRDHEETAAAKAANDMAVRRAILERLEETRSLEYKTVDGEGFAVSLTLIDARYRPTAVYAACMELGLGVYPVLGFGKSAGCWGPKFTAYRNTTATEKPGDNWNLKKDGRIWVVHANADHWKTWEHDRWMTHPEMPGCMKLFGTSSGEKRLSFDEQGHHAYSRHIVAEVEVEEMVKGVLKRYWKPKPGHNQNHYLDASYYADVAASILGIRLPMAQHAKVASTLPGLKAKPNPAQRPTAAQMAARVRA